MTKINNTKTAATAKTVVGKAFNIAKVTVVVMVVITSLVGSYVLANSELRNRTIDFAQNQHEVRAQSPKE